nr:LamG-like jellyroll fold domain-containing protein [Nocardioides daedukensis]
MTPSSEGYNFSGVGQMFLGWVRRAVTPSVLLLVGSAMVVAGQSQPQVSSAPEVSVESLASSKAVAGGEPVVVESLTSETVEVSALPSGAFRADLSVSPVRTEVDGEWLALDPTLVRNVEGTFSARRIIGDLRVSGGGPAGSVIAEYSDGDFSYAVSSPFALSAPVVSGEFATFAEVVPGVDLVVESQTLGFSHNWVVKTPEAAADPRVLELSLPVQMTGLEAVEESGGLAYVDDAAGTQLWSPAPLVWDSSDAAEDSAGGPVLSSVEAVEGGPATGDVVAEVAAEPEADSLVLRPEAELMSSPDTVFPVVVDPTINRLRNGWTAVWSNFPSSSFWQTPHSLGAGYEGWEQNKVVRSYFRFDTKVLSGKRIVSAEVNVRQVHAAQCAVHPTRMYQTNPISTATTWSNQPTRKTLQDTNESTRGCSSSWGPGMVGWDVKPGAQSYANAGASNGTFMVKGSSETARNGWKQFDDAGANMQVDYVSEPHEPSYARVAGGAMCGTAAAPRVTGSTYVLAAAQMNSPDKGKTLRGVFQLYDAFTTTFLEEKANGTSVERGDRVTVAFDGLDDGRTYRFRVKTRGYVAASTSSGAYWDGPFASTLSGTGGMWCYFRVDTSKPASPTIQTSVFTTCDSTQPDNPLQCPVVGRAGTAGQFTVDSTASDVVRYEWWLNDGPVTSVATVAGAARTLTVVPDTEINRLTVKAVDSANKSSDADFIFRVAKRRASLEWAFPAGSLAQSSGTAAGGDLSLSSLATAGAGRVETGLRLDGSATSGDGAVSTDGAFSVSAWVRIDRDLSATRPVISAMDSTGAMTWSLSFDSPSGQWRTGGPSGPAVTAPAIAGVWTHLGVTRSASGTLRLFVNGHAAGSAPVSLLESSAWSLGCDGAAGGACAVGLIDEVAVFDSVFSGHEAVALANPIDAGEDAIVSLSSMWDMVEADPSTAQVATDKTFDHDLALTNVPLPAFVAKEAPASARVLRLPGTSTQRVRSSGPVVDTSGSFSILARVGPIARDAAAVVLEQRGLDGSLWRVRYEPTSPGQGRWILEYLDANGTAQARVSSRESDPEFGWTSLIAVYDSAAGKIQLYAHGAPVVDDTGGLDRTMPMTSAARGVFAVGEGTVSGAAAPLQGDVALIHAYAGAISAAQALEVEDQISAMETGS